MTCPWGQCEHTANAHGNDHCLGCFCVKPPPPMAAPVTQTEEVELEALQLDVCRLCSAYVEDREKHVTWHERMTDTLTNLVMGLSVLERRTDSMQGQIGALDRAYVELDRQIDRRPEF